MATPKAVGTNRDYAEPDLFNHINEVLTTHDDAY